MFYVAVSLAEGGRQLGFVRLAMPLSTLNMALRRVQVVLLVGLLLVLTISMALGYKLSLKLTRPLEQITEAAEHISGGDLETRIYLNREDEIGELAEALNFMAESLQEQLKEISANRDQLEAILSTMMEGIILFNHEGKAVKANPAAESMLGLTSKNWFGRQALEIVRNVELHEKIAVAHNDMVVLEHEFRMVFPERKVLRVSLVPFKTGGQVVNVLAVFHDITRLRRLEDMRADFAANVSHELRTPLTAIRGFSETLLDGAYDDPDVSQRFARIIHREAERLYQLIEELLMLSQIESGKTIIQIEPVSVELLIKEVLERMSGQFEKHDVHADIPDHIPPVAGDRGLLSQALYNLLDNAVKYTPPGGSITIAAEHHNGSVRISVSDTGIGIPVDAQDRIFERFYRVDRARSRRQGGTGLGLAIVKHIADAQGARLDLESEEGRGTSVTLILPVYT
jgi:two-component system phosphate regulon sensor histidine kinase PhoR